MRRLVLATLFIFVLLAVMVSISPRTYAESLGCGPADVQRISAQIIRVTKGISSFAAKGQCDQAIALLKEFDPYPLCPDAAESRLVIAKALRKAGRSSEAAKLLRLTAANDRYNKCTPESLSLLANILYFDLKDRTEYSSYMAMLAVEYYPGIPEVLEARKSFGKELPSVPISQKILLDETLGEASIFNRFFLGSSNFCQWDVIRTLGENGFIVHDNSGRAPSGLIRSVMNQYGLVIMNGGFTNGRTMSPKIIGEIVSYVDGGGKLLVVNGTATCGGANSGKYYNPLMRKFGMEFDESYSTGNTWNLECTPAPHPAMSGISKFNCGWASRLSGGTPLGYYNNQMIMSIAQYGKGTVIASAMGTGFMGCTIGDLYRNTAEKQAQAKLNRDLVLKLAQYLTSQGAASVSTPNQTVEKNSAVILTH